MGEIISWKGLTATERSRIRGLIFLSLYIVMVSMNFLQLGFVAIAPFGTRICYVMGLLGPIAVSSLLLGTKLGALMGFLSATTMCFHAWLEPLDIVEKCIVLSVPPAFIALYVVVGLLVAALYALSLRNDPAGMRRTIKLSLACVVPALLASLVFQGSVHVGSYDSTLTPADLGSPVIQAVLDIALMVVVTLATSRIAQLWYERRPFMSVRTIVRSNLLSVLAVVFITTLAACFVAITRADRNDAYRSMGEELSYVSHQCNEHWARTDELQANPELVSLSNATKASLADDLSARSIVEGYTEKECSIAVVENGTILYSNSAAYPEGASVNTALGPNGSRFIESLAKSGDMLQTLHLNEEQQTELAYARAAHVRNSCYVLMEMPFSAVFDHRRETMAGATVVAIVLLGATYALGSRLLRKSVMGPIDRVNSSLGRIVEGDLDVVVSEVGSVEFSSLSAQINETVDALKLWIAEAEHRRDRELATAQEIQESALPKEFPNNDAFDLFASMVPAREVGGDFYDFFLVGEHTLGFLIADVSGKGIPAALFMMRAKNELNTCMQSGMELAEAIDQANKHLCEGNDTFTFVTVWAGMFDWESGVLDFVNAGHNEPLLHRNGSWEWIRESDGPLMGFADYATFASRSIELHTGDELVLFTDGVTEAMNESRKQYGEENLENLVKEHAGLSPAKLDAAIRADLATWAGNADQSDDITLLVLRVR